MDETTCVNNFISLVIKGVRSESTLLEFKRLPILNLTHRNNDTKNFSSNQKDVFISVLQAVHEFIIL